MLEAIISHKHLVPADIPNNHIKATDGIGTDISHRRLLIHKPKQFLAVIDLLASDQIHDYSQWFHLSPELKLSQEQESRIEVFQENGATHSVIHFIDQEDVIPNVSIFHGQEDPELVGWHSKDGLELSPNFSFSNQITGESAQFCTVFSHNPNSRRPFINVSSNGRYIRFANKDSNAPFDITIRDNPKGNYEVTCVENNQQYEETYNWD